jgi:hypothetical protein
LAGIRTNTAATAGQSTTKSASSSGSLPGFLLLGLGGAFLFFGIIKK